jgi:hypothetical protein
MNNCSVKQTIMKQFSKYQALGNAYVVIPQDSRIEHELPAVAMHLSDYRMGIGSDGVLYGPLSSQVASKQNKPAKLALQEKEKLVLMPLRVPEEDKNLTGAMETALVEGLQQKYAVFSGEQVSQKAHEIFMRESRNTAHRECDVTKCMQNIAMAFQAELIATANVTKQDGIYYLALSIQNIFDNKVEYSKSLTCKNCEGRKS